MRLELHDVGKRFAGCAALAGIELDLPSGTRAALVGPNGSGKSTLVRLLMGMLAGTGAIRIDGLDPLRDRVALAGRLAYVPQVAPRLWAPVRDVLAAVGGLRGSDPARIRALAARFDLDLDSLLARPFRALSGGMRQKLLAVLALAADAELLLLDEPTASMDPGSRSTFFAILDELPLAPTVLLCSHRVEEIRRHVDHVLVLGEGRLQWQGSTADYLGARAAAVVELTVGGADDGAGAWLHANGFRPGRTGWWTRATTAEDRVGLVGRVLRELGSVVTDLTARDLEHLPQPEELRP